MLIINSVTPLKPSGLLKVQGKLILGSFIVAGIISPTPDMLNQTLLAAPLIVMYYLSIVLVWRKNRRQKPFRAAGAVPAIPQPSIGTGNILADFLVQERIAAPVAPKVIVAPQPTAPAHAARRRSIDGMTLNVPRRTEVATTQKTPSRPPQQATPRVVQRRTFNRRVSMDGFFVSASV